MFKNINIPEVLNGVTERTVCANFVQSILSHADRALMVCQTLRRQMMVYEKSATNGNFYVTLKVFYDFL